MGTGGDRLLRTGEMAQLVINREINSAIRVLILINTPDVFFFGYNMSHGTNSRIVVCNPIASHTGLFT